MHTISLSQPSPYLPRKNKAANAAKKCAFIFQHSQLQYCQEHPKSSTRWLGRYLLNRLPFSCSQNIPPYPPPHWRTSSHRRIKRYLIPHGTINISRWFCWRWYILCHKRFFNFVNNPQRVAQHRQFSIRPFLFPKSPQSAPVIIGNHFYNLTLCT